jgi:hypothetical protein
MADVGGGSTPHPGRFACWEWDTVQWDTVQWDTEQRDTVQWDTVQWDTVPIVQKNAWNPGRVWTNVEDLTITGI